MTKMIRKQIYIENEQEALIKENSTALGISEAEIIRQALSRYLSGAHELNVQNAWEKEKKFINKRKDTVTFEKKDRTWKREELYEERLIK